MPFSEYTICLSRFSFVTDLIKNILTKKFIKLTVQEFGMFIDHQWTYRIPSCYLPFDKLNQAEQ